MSSASTTEATVTTPPAQTTQPPAPLVHNLITLEDDDTPTTTTNKRSNLQLDKEDDSAIKRPRIDAGAGGDDSLKNLVYTMSSEVKPSRWSHIWDLSSEMSIARDDQTEGRVWDRQKEKDREEI